MTSNAETAPLRTDAELEAELNAALSDELGGGSAYQDFVVALLEQVKGIEPPRGTQQRVFQIDGPVPRTEPYQGLVQTAELFLRLENKIYGPLDDQRLSDLLTSGILTGYESVTRDFVRWTPVAYHPRIVLADSVDPDLTHDALSGVSDLPAPAPKRETIPEDPRVAADPPLSVVFRKVPRPNVFKLQMVGDLNEESLEAVADRITGDHEIVVAIRQEDESPEPPAVAEAAPSEITPLMAPAETEVQAKTAVSPAQPGSDGGSKRIAMVGLVILLVVAAMAVFLGLV